MYALIAASVERSNACSAVIAVDVMHVETGRVIGARVLLGRAGSDHEFEVDGYEAHGVDERRELEGFVRSIRAELEARLAEGGEAES